MKGAGGEPLMLQFLDVSRAYPHAETLRDDRYVEAVPQMGLPGDACLLARRDWYAMRVAGQAFEFAVRDHFLDHDFIQEMFSPCVFAHRSKLLLYFVHGDDYVGLGLRCDFGCLQGKASSKTKATPWDKAAFLARHPLEGSFLNEKRRVAFRSNCMRCLYLALDRPNIQFTAKDISRAVASPTLLLAKTCLEDILPSRPARRRRSVACRAEKRSFTGTCGVLVERWGWRVSCRICHWRSRQTLWRTQTWCGENSTHPLSCTVASTRRGTTTDCDYPACGKKT